MTHQRNNLVREQNFDYLTSSDNSYICKFVTKQFHRDYATYHRNKLCQYGKILRSSDKLHVYLVLIILITLTREYKFCVLVFKNFSSRLVDIW